MKTIILSFVLFFSCSLFSQVGISTLENYGKVYDENTPLRKLILAEIEEKGSAEVELYGTPFHEGILILSRAIIATLWEFPDKVTFNFYPLIVDEKSDSIGANNEVKRIISFEQIDKNKYLEYLYRRGNYITFQDFNRPFEFDLEAAENLVSYKEVFDEKQINSLIFDYKKRNEEIIQEILNSKERSDKLYSEYSNASESLMSMSLWATVAKSGLKLSEKTLDSIRTVKKQRFFEEFPSHFVELKIGGRAIEKTYAELLLPNIAFLQNRLEGLKDLENSPKVINEKIEKRGRCPKIEYVNDNYLFSKNGFELTYFPQKKPKKIKYEIVAKRGNAKVFQEVYTNSEGFLNQKLPVIYPKGREEICFELKILKGEESCSKTYKRCFKEICPKIEISNKTRYKGNEIALDSTQFATVQMSVKGYDEYGNFMNKKNIQLRSDRSIVLNGRSDNFWGTIGQTYKNQFIKKNCLSFEMINMVDNSKVDYCDLPADTCIYDEKYEEVFDGEILKEKELKNDFEIDYELRYIPKKLNRKFNYVRYELVLKIDTIKLSPPISLIEIYPKKSKKGYSANSMREWPGANEKRKNDDKFYHYFAKFIRRANITVRHQITESETSTTSEGKALKLIELVDSKGKIKSIFLELDFQTKRLNKKDIDEKFEELKKRSKPILLGAKNCADTTGAILGASIKYADLQDGNRINLKPGKYDFKYQYDGGVITKTYMVPSWSSELKRDIKYNPPEKGTCLGEIKIALNKKYLPYHFSVKDKVWKDTIVNDTVLHLKNLCNGYYDFRVDNPETCPEGFRVYIGNCGEIQDPKVLIKNESMVGAKDGMIRLVFPQFGFDHESKLNWDNGMQGFVNPKLSKGTHRVVVENEKGCRKEFEFKLE